MKLKINRRDILKLGLTTPFAQGILSSPAFADPDTVIPRGKRFLLQIHLDSMCGLATGLTQPLKVGQWPLGFNEAGKVSGSTNPHLNRHTQAGNMIFHDYIKFLTAMADDMCLVAGTPNSLDHGTAFNLQNRGNTLTSFSPEWSMAVAQVMKTAANPNPMILTSGLKTASVADIVTVKAADMDEFKAVTRDVASIVNVPKDPLMEHLKNRYAQASLGTVLLDKNLGTSAAYQLNTLAVGLAELAQSQGDLDAMNKYFSSENTDKMLGAFAERNKIRDSLKLNLIINPPHPFREELKLAGVLAKTGLASGMTISVSRGFEDTHVGGAELNTTRNASAVWILIAQFWQWVRAANLQDDIMIVVSHDFSRTAYNNYKSVTGDIIDPSGKTIKIESPGRDHALAMGMMFINGKLPKSGRIGVVTDNIVPTAGKDAKGTIDSAGAPYSSQNIVGSMLMRVFDDLYPNERMVRKHWPTFTEIPEILT